MHCILVISVITLFFSILEVLEQNRLESTSAVLIEWIQIGRTEEGDSLFNLIGAITSICFFVISGVLYLTGKREAGLLGIFGSQLGAAFSGALKMAFAHPRPFWKYSVVEGLQCPKDFGAPSGHAVSAGAGLLVLGFIWIKLGSQRTLKSLIIIIIVLVTGYDRLYLGVHFYFQIALGYSFAALIAVILVDPITMSYVQRLGNDKNLLIKSQVILAGLLILSLLTCFFRNPEWDPLWSLNYQKTCGKPLVLDEVILKNAADSGVFCLVAGLIMGHFLLKEKKGPQFSFQLLVVSTILHIGYINIFLKYVESSFILSTQEISGWLFLSSARYICGIAYTYLLPTFISKLFKTDDTTRELPSFSGLNFKIKVWGGDH